MKKVLSYCVIVVLSFACSNGSYEELMEKATHKFETGNYTTAKKLVKKAIQLKPTAEAYKLLGNVYLIGEENFKEAEKAYKKALQLNPNYPNAMHNLGLLYLTQYERVWEKTFTNMKKSEKKKWKQKLKESKQYLKKARNWFEKVLAKYPDFSLTREEMVKLLFFEKKYNKAIELGKEILKKSPENFRVIFQMGIIYLFGKENAKKALKYLGQAVELEPTVADLYWFRYKAYKKLKKKKAAKAEFGLYLEALKKSGLPNSLLKEIKEKKVRYIP